MAVARMPDTDQEVERRAYALWESEGRPHGRDREHWERAKRDVTAAEAPETPPAAPEAATPEDPEAAATLIASAPKKRRAPARAPRPAATDAPPTPEAEPTVAPTRKPARRRTEKPQA